MRPFGFKLFDPTFTAIGPVQVDVNHPIANQLKGVWLFNTANPQNIVQQNAAGNGTGLNSPTIVNDIFGPATLFDGVSQAISTVGGLFPALPAFSVSVWIKPTAANFITTGHNGRFMANGHTDSDNAGFQLFFNGAGGNTVAFQVGNGTTFVGAVSLASTWAIQWWHFVGVYDGANVQLYVNGAFNSQTALTGSISSTTPIGFAYNPVYSGDQQAATMWAATLHYRALKAHEPMQMFLNPLVCLKPAASKPYLVQSTFVPQRHGIRIWDH